MANDAGATWTTNEDVMLCSCWVQVTHDPITGNEMTIRELWKSVLALYLEKMGGQRTTQSLSNRWKVLNASFSHWRDGLSQASNNLRSGQNLADQMLQAQTWYNAKNKNKSFNRWECWDIVKDCPKYRIVPIGPEVVMHGTPLHFTPEEDLGSTQQDDPEEVPETPEEPVQPTRHSLRPQGKKASKKKVSSSKNDYTKYIEELGRQSELSLQRDMARIEAEMARDERRAIATERRDAATERHREALKQEREMLRQERRAREDREIMEKCLDGMKPDEQYFWTRQKQEVVRRMRAADQGTSGGHASSSDPSTTYPSTTNWFPY